MKKTYFYCKYDSYGQRSGYYDQIELSASEIETINGCMYWKGNFLYSSFSECLWACQS